MFKIRFSYLTLILIPIIFAGCQSGGMSKQQQNWGVVHGGLVHDEHQTRATRLCSALTAGAIREPIRIHVLATAAPAAYSWSSRDIYVSTGLMDTLNDAQLTACIAHEIGHLINDRHCDGVAALQGHEGSNPDEEKAADATGVRLLSVNHMPQEWLIEALQTLHDSDSCACPRTTLEDRINTLKAASKNPN